MQPEETGPAVIEPGTRDKRRMVTRRAIETIAVDLALQLGSDQVTVEMICDRALISVRTFYNYFPTKDAALAGGGPPPPDESALDAFRRGTDPDVLGDLLRMLALTLEQAPEERQLKRARGRLLRQEPQLMASVSARLAPLSQALIPPVIDRLTRSSPAHADRAAAELLINIATAILTTALHEWAHHGAENDDPADVLHRTITLAQQLTAAWGEDAATGMMRNQFRL